MTIQDIKMNINRQLRNNLLFTSNEAEGIHYVDIGMQLSSLIEDNIHDSRLGIKAEDALKKILNRSFCEDEDIGEYLAIKNIGILFEPALHLDVKAILNSWSRDHVLIVKHEGTFRDGIFYLSPHSAKHFVNLIDIIFKSL